MNKVRCAIYTRKSSDEGLDQAFNSLDAQREACEAYIKSQKHEGWKALPTLYNDGGASGGNLERTALQQLLVDVDSGRVDMIVVYKIDRLTRSLSDFAKLVDRLDAASASFVSVTQQFNTSTSMGRLTLNVLLSFAQFEREVTAERIRDKIAASKRKGMWMGGLVPLGYDKSDAGLKINAPEAETVRTLFRSYPERGCVRKLKDDADKARYRTKTRVLLSGRVVEGRPFSRGRLYHLLSNPIYVGKIKHKEEVYDGLHKAIVETELWDRVQSQLSRNAVARTSRKNSRNPSPLAGKVIDQDGNPLTPNHACKSGRRYRYYIDRAGNTRIPAGEIENAVQQAIGTDRICRLHAEQTGCKTSLEQVVQVRLQQAQLAISVSLSSDKEVRQVVAPFTLRRRGVESRIVLNSEAQRPADLTLINSILRSMDWVELIKQGKTISEVAADHGVTPGYITHMLGFAYLSPKILKAISAGMQRPDISASKISKTDIPVKWVDQDVIFLD